jgi:superfamily II DNA/RNA helicase
VKEDDDDNDETKSFFEEKPFQVVASGGLKHLSQLDDILEDILETSFQRKEKEINFDIETISAEQVRGFDDKNVKMVVILSKADSIREFVHWSGRVGRMGNEGDAVHVLSRTWMRETAEYCERLGLKFKVLK